MTAARVVKPIDRQRLGTFMSNDQVGLSIT